MRSRRWPNGTRRPCAKRPTCWRSGAWSTATRRVASTRRKGGRARSAARQLWLLPFWVLTVAPLSAFGQPTASPTGQTAEALTYQMTDLASAHDTAAIQALHSALQEIHVPGLEGVYWSALYQADPRAFRRTFVDHFPVDEVQELSLLWEMDSSPKLRGSWPIFELAGIAMSGDRPAITKLIESQAHSDGVFAEGISDSIGRVLATNTSLTVNVLASQREQDAKFVICAVYFIGSPDDFIKAQRNAKALPASSVGEQRVIEMIEGPVKLCGDSNVPPTPEH